MSEKVEKYIRDYTKNCSNETRITIGKISHWEKQPWLTPDHAREVAEIAKEELIKKAMAFINSRFYFNNLHNSVENNSYNCMEELFEDFRKSLEGE